MPNGRSLMITSAPKSGTTWLYHLLRDITAASPARLAADWEFGAEIDAAKIIDATRTKSPWIAMMHMCPSKWTEHAVTRFDVTTIVLVRDIFDSIVSYDDEIMRSFRGREAPITSMLHIPDQYIDWDPPKRLDFLIALYTPWLALFLNRWSQVPFEMHWVTYEQLLTDTHGTLRRILDAAGFGQIGAERIEAAIHDYRGDGAKASQHTRFNKGVVGRGKSKLSDGQKREMLRILSFYPDLDLEGLGVLGRDRAEHRQA